MNRIICIGNKYIPGDDIGPRVYDHLSRQRLPDNVQVIDGGLAGLNLLQFVESARRVVFVDALEKANPTGGRAVPYDHAAGLDYLLQVIPAVCKETPPEIILLGIESDADEQTIALAAEACLKIVVRGYHENLVPPLGRVTCSKLIFGNGS